VILVIGKVVTVGIVSSLLQEIKMQIDNMKR